MLPRDGDIRRYEQIASAQGDQYGGLCEAFGKHAEQGLALLTDKSPPGRFGEPEETAFAVYQRRRAIR